MRVRLLVAAIGVLVLGSVLTGCDLVLGGSGGDVDESDASPGAGGGKASGGSSDEPALAEGVLLIADNGTEVREECEHREVVVTADDAIVVLDGACGLVRASGRGTTVEVGSADKIVLIGVDNEVSFAAGDPEIINRGRNTTVTEGGSATV